MLMDTRSSSSTKSDSDDDIKPIVDERIGQFLSSSPPVAEQILCNLNARDLNRCACVCKLWSQIAEVVKRKREELLWMFQVTFYPGGDLGMLTGGRDDEHITEDCIYACDSDDPWGVGNHFYEMVVESPIQPQNGILFCSARILGKPHRYFSSFERADEDDPIDSTPQSFYYHEPLMQYLATDLPRNCRMVCCGAPGIIGTPVDNSSPSEVEQLNGFSGLLLPNIPGVQVHPFSVPEDEAYSSRKRRKYEGSEITQLTGIPEGTNVKALLMFCEELPDRGGITRAIIEHYMTKQELKIAVGGAIVDTVIGPMKNKDQWPMASGIIFTGEKLNASSIVISQKIRSVEVLEAKLVEFKTGSILGKTSVAFMFACCGRGCSYYGESNVEAKTFRKIFPKTLLFGCFSNGEIGINHLPNATPTPEKKFTVESKSQKLPTWVHGYTTIFVLLSW